MSPTLSAEYGKPIIISSEEGGLAGFLVKYFKGEEFTIARTQGEEEVKKRRLPFIATGWKSQYGMDFIPDEYKKVSKSKPKPKPKPKPGLVIDDVVVAAKPKKKRNRSGKSKLKNKK